MITLTLATQLKEAGLVWPATTNDFFAVPERGMDDRLFVLTDMQAQLDVFRGWPVVTFHGTSEWALDYILTAEAVWIPREEQLRERLISLLQDETEVQLSLHFAQDITCVIPWHGTTKQFKADSAADAYGIALLFVLENQRPT